MPTDQLEQPQVEQETTQVEPAVETDPQAELLEQESTTEPVVEDAPAPQMDPAVLELIQRQQQIIEGLQQQKQPQEQSKAAPLMERLRAKGMDEGTAKLFNAFVEEFMPDLGGKFLERDYGVLLHHVASTTDERAAVDAIRANHKATDDEIGALTPHLEAVKKEYGNLPTKARYELALNRKRATKTATGLTAARHAKQEGLKKLTPPTKGGSTKLVPDKLSDADWEKLSPLQRTAALNGLDPAKYAGM